MLSVARGSPAEAAGLRPTDVLCAIDDHVLRRPSDIIGALADREVDALVRVRLQRAGRWLERLVRVTPESSSFGRRARA